jgi:hypothetical protein
MQQRGVSYDKNQLRFFRLDAGFVHAESAENIAQIPTLDFVQ